MVKYLKIVKIRPQNNFFPIFLLILLAPESCELLIASFVAMGNGKLGLWITRAATAILDKRFSEIFQAVYMCLRLDLPVYSLLEIVYILSIAEVSFK